MACSNRETSVARLEGAKERETEAETMGTAPCKIRGVGESTKQKVGRLWFWG